MRKTIGLIARADNSGLGTCSWELARHIAFDEIKIVSNGRFKTFPERFYNPVDDLKTDIVVSIETFYDYQKKLGQKLVLLPMYECTSPAMAKKADRIISVSLLDKKYYPNSVFIPFPVARDRLPFRLRQKASIFVHNAGHGGLGGRNGTQELLGAFRWVRSDIKLVINSQIPLKTDDPRIEVRIANRENYWEGYEEGDVCIRPEKFNGLSLPINESISVGMPIMVSDRYPFNAWLPREIMIPVKSYKVEKIACDFESAIIDPADIARKIDEWANRDISDLSRQMDELANLFSWEKLGEKYKEIIYGA